jgi:hypothetical protein
MIWLSVFVGARSSQTIGPKKNAANTSKMRIAMMR